MVPSDPREPLLPAVGAVVVAPDGRVLLVRRGKAPSRGEWSLVGGHLEPGESFAEATVREVLEETGLAVRVEAELGVVNVAREGFRYAIHEHLCVPLDASAPLRAGSDALDARWARFDELAELGLRPDAVRVVSQALKRTGTPC